MHQVISGPHDKNNVETLNLKPLALGQAAPTQESKKGCSLNAPEAEQIRSWAAS